MSISLESIEKIKSALDIVEVVREYIPSLKRAGRNWKANCPFHNEKTPSFMVSGEKGIFHCFGCQAGGDIFKFVMMIDDLSWPEAVKKLGDKAGILIKETKEENVKRSKKQEIYDLLNQAANFYNKNLNISVHGKIAKQYIEKRGVSAETMDKFKIGFSPYGKLITSALKKGFSHEDLILSGLITKINRGGYYEYMSNRLVFPIFDVQGHIVAFGGRVLRQKDYPKYLNTPETIIYSKSHQLYGLFQAIPSIRETRELIIFEGYMDVVIAHQYKVSNAVATLGTALTNQHAQIIKRYADKVILLFDSDNAGNTAAFRAIDILIDSDLSLKVVNLPDGVDPDEFLLTNGVDEFRNYIDKNSKSVMEFLIDRALSIYGNQTPEAKSKSAGLIIPIINKVKNVVLRQEYIKYLAENLKIDENSILKESNRFNKNLKTDKLKSNKRITKIRTAEEELLQVILACPECLNLINDQYFNEQRNKNLFFMLFNGVSVSEIINKLPEQDIGWFTELIFEDKTYNNPEEIIAALVKDIKQKNLESERKLLETEVTLMINGKISYDSKKIKIYNELTKQLKGSVR